MPIAQTTIRSSPFIKGRWVAVFLISFALGIGTAQASPIGDYVDIDYSASGTTTEGFSFVLDPLDLD